MMIVHFYILLNIIITLINNSVSTTSITTYPTIDLLENSPLNTFVFQLTTPNMKESKFILLNLNGFETNMFSIINGSIYTSNLIDREELIRKKRCFDHLYCTIEIHILVDDGFGYYVIPIHIVDENDNKPEFDKIEIELKFRENVPNGYKIPFLGAMDLDEGRNGEIRYILDCSINSTKNLILNSSQNSSINCLPLFQLIILSQSAINFDRLALKFNPSSSINIQNEYKLKLYAIDNGGNGKELFNSMNLIIKIERKEKAAIFSLSEYEFVVKINSSLINGSILGRVYAISNDPSKIIYYKLLTNNQSNQIKINLLTGEILLINENLIKESNQIDFIVQASIFSNENSFKILTTNVTVKIFFRYFNLINNISVKLEINSNKINQLNNSFLIDQNIQIDQKLLNITIISFHYPLDKYILSLDNYLTTFLLTSSPTEINCYILKASRRLTPKAIYMLNIGVKHKLSQQWLPDLTIELIVIDEWTTTIKTTTTIETTPVTTTIIESQSTTSVLMESFSESSEFCVENISYALRDLDNNNDEIGLLKVVETNSMLNVNISLFGTLSILINQSEMIVDGCRMHIDQLNNSLNKSSHYRLCSLSSDQCYNIILTEQVHPMSMKSENEYRRWLLPMRPIEIAMFTLSMIFIIAAIALTLLICRLKGIHLCLTVKNYLFYGKKYGLNNAQRLSSSKMTQRVHSIVIREPQSPSFQPIKINQFDEPYIFNIEHLFLEREPLPSSNMFTILPTAQVSSSLTSSLEREERTISNIDNRATTRTSSSSSFLQETKQLLEMISTGQNLDLSTLASEV